MILKCCFSQNSYSQHRLLVSTTAEFTLIEMCVCVCVAMESQQHLPPEGVLEGNESFTCRFFIHVSTNTPYFIYYMHTCVAQKHYHHQACNITIATADTRTNINST